MKVDIATLCHSALSEGNHLSILGAFVITYAPSIPYRLPPCALALRLVFDDSDAGSHLVKVVVTGTDGDQLYKREQGIELPSSEPPPTLGTTHAAASLCLIYDLIGVEVKSFGVQAIDVSFDGQPVQQLPFYVYPESARDQS
jgi:hypothetical protein